MDHRSLMKSSTLGTLRSCSRVFTATLVFPTAPLLPDDKLQWHLLVMLSFISLSRSAHLTLLHMRASVSYRSLRYASILSDYEQQIYPTCAATQFVCGPDWAENLIQPNLNSVVAGLSSLDKAGHLDHSQTHGPPSLVQHLLTEIFLSVESTHRRSNNHLSYESSSLRTEIFVWIPKVNILI